MDILLDEQVPELVLAPLRSLLSGHRIDHVQKIGWKGKQDVNLIPDMKRRGYAVLVTADVDQLEDHEECRAIKKAGTHHVRFDRSGSGTAMTASAVATVIAGLPLVIPRLDAEPAQRLVVLKLVRCKETQFTITDPEKDPPTQYWPGRRTVSRRRVPRSRDGA
ncbi:hypothetical protein [Phytohabitans rumicis]|uniref:PIN-like domain-containing protein n=1 Tax=Phytohabitans rumicis TaxID=1076125 RepID=UPI00156733B9|nr:hypothetical protein [Phytohabitans rumicis]